MGRAEKRKFIKQFKDVSGTCPICKKKSVFCTDKEGIIKCVQCGNAISDKKYEQQCFLKIKKDKIDGKNINSDRSIEPSVRN